MLPLAGVLQLNTYVCRRKLEASFVGEVRFARFYMPKARESGSRETAPSAKRAAGGVGADRICSYELRHASQILSCIILPTGNRILRVHRARPEVEAVHTADVEKW